ncbi:MAG: hypothetical protein CL930_09465 [Deltaproteobacteria bacterium]|nr:hypothetical protein [Deltaproteobacteria bacterium]
MNVLISLDSPNAVDRSIVGGKAAVLAQLKANGMSVMSGFVIPAGELDTFLDSKGWSERAKKGDPSLSDAIRKTRLGPELAGALREACGRLGGQFVVRSSGIDEDGVESSWAGQFETVIGVHPGDETESAVLRCWASAFDARAEAYRSKTGKIHRVRLAILVQPVVESRCAGVLFTVNPLTGSWREMTVEAAWGQAAPVVQGEVVPDYYVVRRPRRVPRSIQRVLARIQLDVVEDVVRPQKEACHVTSEGLVSVPVEAARVDAPKLRHAELLRLCRLGLRVEGLLGGPQDIEWALGSDGGFVVLQSRPVTTGVGVRRTGEALWTRRFIGERWTEPATPLGWSLMGGLIHSFIEYPETQKRYLGGGSPTRMERFAPYLNVTIFRYLSFKLPGAPPPRFMMELLPPGEQRGWFRRRGQAPDLRVYSSVLKETVKGRRWERFAANPFTNPACWEEFLGRLDEQLPLLMNEGADLQACMALADRCRALAAQYVGIHICSLLFANLFFQVCEGMLLARDQVQLSKDVLRPTKPSWTVRTNHALWLLGREEITMESFIDQFGHRAPSSWEIFSPRWSESLSQVSVLAQAAAQHGDPEALAAEQAQRARSASGAMKGLMKSLVSRTQEYLLLRENQRFHFDRLLWAWKQQLMAVERMTGLEIRFLQIEELEALIAERLPAKDAEERIIRRKKSWMREIERRALGDEPPTFAIGTKGIEVDEAAIRLQGTGTSPGVVTGTVRVLRSPGDAGRLQPGDILVARATDPGWTPLFLKVGAVVVELGGMLSHGAVVAREYGLPAVVNVAGATTVLKDGQLVTVDGKQGVVWVR